MANCAVATCSNYLRKTRKLDVHVVYHRFPKDPEICKLWLTKCKRQDEFNYKNASICSEHFSSEDYEDDMRNRLLGLPQKKLLKCTAVPSLKLPGNEEDVNKRQLSEDRNNRSVTRRIRGEALERIHSLSPKRLRFETQNPGVSTENTLNVCNTSECSRCDDFNNVTVENVALKKEIHSLRSELNDLKNKKRKELKKYKRKLNYCTTRLAKQIKDLKQLNRELRLLKKNCIQHSTAINAVKTVLTPGQIKSLSCKGVIRWTSEDISRAVMLRALSRKTYSYLRENVKFPLPSPATLSRWCSKFICLPGILKSILMLVQRCCEGLPELDKLCVLSFDEMHIDSRIEYSIAMDKIVGPHSKVQVVLIRGLCAKWKQPIFYDFDVTMKKDLLFSIINAIEDVGVKVCAIVSDLGGCGTLWKELTISTKQTSFTNPTDPTRNVWVFADMPHYIKLLRNHFLDEGLVLEDGTEVTVDILQKTLQEDKGEIKLCHKLDPSFLTLRGNDRQRVGPAKAVFSRTTAKAIEALTGNKKVAKFFELVDSFSDVMNSNSPYPPNSQPLRAGFGLSQYHEKQTEILNEMETATRTMRVKGKKSLLPFQKGILISITSLVGLLAEAGAVHNLKYILTTHLTQDVLENLFSQIRGTGHFYDHPTPIEVMSRIKTLLLSNKMPKPSTKSNFEQTGDVANDASAYLTADILDSAFEPSEVKEIIYFTPEPVDDHDVTFVNFEESDEPEKSWAEEEAISYIAGYVAYKVREEDPTLGTMTKDLPPNLQNDSWIEMLSYAGLTVPTDSWKNTVNDFEKVFESLHGKEDLYNKEKGVIKELKRRLSDKFPNVCPKAIHVYSRIRTFIRIRQLNRCVEKKRSEIKKAKKWINSNKHFH